MDGRSESLGRTYLRVAWLVSDSGGNPRRAPKSDLWALQLDLTVRT